MSNGYVLSLAVFKYLMMGWGRGDDDFIMV
jgi:hypothetical protein